MGTVPDVPEATRQAPSTAREAGVRLQWNRKIRYARLLVHALDLDLVPRPLDSVLASVTPTDEVRADARS